MSRWDDGEDDDWGRTHARGDDPDTSHDAAEFNAHKATMMATLERVYLRVHPEGLIAAEAAPMAGYSAADGAWKRVSDLLRDGALADTGERRRAVDTGRLQRVLVWVPPEKRNPEPETEPEIPPPAGPPGQLDILDLFVP